VGAGWFFPPAPPASNTETGRHDIAEILLKVALNTKHSKSNSKGQFFEGRNRESREKPTALPQVTCLALVEMCYVGLHQLCLKIYGAVKIRLIKIVCHFIKRDTKFRND
jgi:hypothetical protein